MSPLVWFEIQSDLGRWRGVVTERGLSRLTLVDRAAPPPADAVRDDDHPAAREIREFLAGRRREFTVPVDLSGVAPFRRRVLETLRRDVPFGRTTTYGELAKKAGRPGAARAVGSAMATNPVPLVIPCHRVVASQRGPLARNRTDLRAARRSHGEMSDTALGGFGFGLDAKRWLLKLEGVTAL